MNALKATGLAHAYGKGAARVDVLKNFDLELASGAFEALMGSRKTLREFDLPCQQPPGWVLQI